MSENFKRKYCYHIGNLPDYLRNDSRKYMLERNAELQAGPGHKPIGSGVMWFCPDYRSWIESGTKEYTDARLYRMEWPQDKKIFTATTPDDVELFHRIFCDSMMCLFDFQIPWVEWDKVQKDWDGLELKKGALHNNPSRSLSNWDIPSMALWKTEGIILEEIGRIDNGKVCLY